MSSEIKIFEKEKELGLAEKIIASSTISYISELIKESPIEKNLPQDLQSIIARASTEDIYRTYSILVSTVWNLNDDVFDPYEVWIAKDTPVHKQSNMDHQEKVIIGTITDCWPVTDNYELIFADTPVSNLPSHYHLLVSSIIYTKWRDPEMNDMVQTLIQAIENNNKWVSMECIFYGFDYAVIAPDGTKHIIERKEETSFLTQHLRAYGGTGVYQNHRIGRLLRNIIFTGKGYTDNPANPESITFTKDKQFIFDHAASSNNLFTEDNGVNENSESTIISSENNTENIMENEKLIADLEAAQSSVQALTAEVTSLKTQNSELQSQLETVSAQLTEVSAERDSFKNEILAMKEDKKKKARTDKMKTKCSNLSDEEVEAKVLLFNSLTDEQFDAMVDMIVPAQAAVVETVVEEVEATEIVEEVENETTTHSIASENDDNGVNNLQDAMAAFASKVIDVKASRLNKQ